MGAHQAGDCCSIHSIEDNVASPHFQSTRDSHKSTWQCADNAVKDNLIREKELGLQELSDSISGDQHKTTAVRLKTFYTQNESRKKYKHQPAGPRKSDEVAALLRMTQHIIATGGEVDIVNFIGNHECIKTPPSLFNEDETTSAAGTMANLVSPERRDSCKCCS